MNLVLAITNSDTELGEFFVVRVAVHWLVWIIVFVSSVLFVPSLIPCCLLVEPWVLSKPINDFLNGEVVLDTQDHPNVGVEYEPNWLLFEQEVVDVLHTRQFKNVLDLRNLDRGGIALVESEPVHVLSKGFIPSTVVLSVLVVVVDIDVLVVLLISEVVS